MGSRKEMASGMIIEDGVDFTRVFGNDQVGGRVGGQVQIINALGSGQEKSAFPGVGKGHIVDNQLGRRLDIFPWLL